jgi:hypothetical protein
VDQQWDRSRLGGDCPADRSIVDFGNDLLGVASRHFTLPLNKTCEHIQFSVREIEESSSCSSIIKSSASRFVALPLREPPMFRRRRSSAWSIRFGLTNGGENRLSCCFSLGNGNTLGVAGDQRACLARPEKAPAHGKAFWRQTQRACEPNDRRGIPRPRKRSSTSGKIGCGGRIRTRSPLLIIR